MKNMLLHTLAPFLFLALLTGCSDDDTANSLVTPVATPQVQGKWKVDVITYQYFDASGKKIFEENDTLDYIQIYDFKEGGKGVLTYSDYPNIIFNFDYTLTTKDNKQVLTLKENTATLDHRIEKFENNKMVWQADEDETEYFENGTNKTASKALQWHYLIKN